MIDSHVHSYFSGDSEMNPEIACNEAIKLNLAGLAFTDHLDYDYPNIDIEFNIDFDKYSKYINKLKAKYINKLKVLKGIEVGLQPHVIKKSLKIIEYYDFDVVIASIHIVDKTDLHNGDFCIGKTQKVSYTKYLEEVFNIISSFDNFDILGHMDLIRRYGNYTNKTLKYFEYSDIIDCIFNILIKKGKALEINSSGYRYNLNSTMPDFDIVKRYKELGGELITLGSDAHSPLFIGYKFKNSLENLSYLGYKYITHFENRKPFFTKI